MLYYLDLSLTTKLRPLVHALARCSGQLTMKMVQITTGKDSTQLHVESAVDGPGVLDTSCI